MDKQKRQIKETLAGCVFALAASVSIVAVALICLFLLVNGTPALREIGIIEFITGNVWKPIQNIFGILPMIMGSVYVTLGAIIIGVPIGLLTAIFLARYGGKKTVRVLNPAIELLAGIPSVVYGFFGLVVIVPIIRDMFGGMGTSMLAASILLGIMILPTIITVSAAAIKAVSNSYYEGAVALGASHERAVFSVVVPAAGSGILAGVILGMGRAIGETMAVVMVAGNQPRMPAGLLKGVRTLTSNIVMEMGYSADLHREALISTALVLFVFILIINMLFRIISRRRAK